MRTAFALMASLAFGCSSSSSAPTASSTDAGESADVVAEVAPTSCGTNIGDTLCDLDLQGYVRDATDGLASTVAPGGPFKLSEALATGKQRYAFVFNTAYW